MSPIDIALLLGTAAVWGSSFTFMRFLAPLVGPVFTADMRTLLAGLFLALLFLITGFRPGWRKNARHFLVIGMVNSGIPFLLYSYAALTLPASIEAILNALSPLFAAVFSAIWLGERLTVKKLAGLGLGIGGVALVTGTAQGSGGGASLTAAAACVLATICYGLAGIYIKRKASDVKPTAVAGGSQLAAGIVLFPLVFLAPPPAREVFSVGPIIVLFALLCSAIAYLMYYRLIASAGPTKALTVTFLIPVFGMAGSALVAAPRFLDSAAGYVIQFFREQRNTPGRATASPDGRRPVRKDPPDLARNSAQNGGPGAP